MSGTPTDLTPQPGGVGTAMGVGGGVPPTLVPAGPVNEPELERQLQKPRTLFSALLSLVTGIMAVLAMVPLFSVLFMLIWEGGKRLSLALFYELPPAAGMDGGGLGNALVGTLIMVLIATLVSVPVGILIAVYIGELEPRSRIAEAVRFSAKVLTGLPSVLAGLFIYAAIVVWSSYSPIAGGLSLALLMLPTIILTAEQAIKMVPARMREAAVGMGATKTQVILQVTLPTAMPGILTGIMLGVARAAGETAPLLFTALFSRYWMLINRPLEPSASLAVLIYDYSRSPFPNQTEIAWSASLVLVFLVLVANITAQFWSGRQVRR
jgi:phosphate transport system permease protein